MNDEFDTDHDFGVAPSDEAPVSTTSNAGYMIAARMAIQLALDEDELRLWWKDQEIDRANNAVTQEQEKELIELSKRQIEKLKLKRMAEKKGKHRRALI